MRRVVVTGEVEADLAALRGAAERAGTALACLFTSSQEFEAQVIRVRRAQGAYGPVAPPRRRWLKFLSVAVLIPTLLLL